MAKPPIKKTAILSVLDEKGPLNLVELRGAVSEFAPTLAQDLYSFMAKIRARSDHVDGGTNGAKYRITEEGEAFLEENRPLLQSIRPATDARNRKPQKPAAEPPPPAEPEPPVEGEEGEAEDVDIDDPEPAAEPAAEPDLPLGEWREAPRSFPSVTPLPRSSPPARDPLPELVAMDEISRAFDRLPDNNERRRVIAWLNDRYRL